MNDKIRAILTGCEFMDGINQSNAIITASDIAKIMNDASYLIGRYIPIDLLPSRLKHSADDRGSIRTVAVRHAQDVLGSVAFALMDIAKKSQDTKRIK